MRFIHWLVRKLPKEWADDIERESRAWKLVCPACDHRISFWDIGGVRYKAVSKGKRTLWKCPKCKALKWHRVEKEKT